MAQHNVENVVAIQEVQLHKVGKAAIHLLLRGNRQDRLYFHLQVEGGQEALLEWAPFNVQLISHGNESELTAHVCEYVQQTVRLCQRLGS